MSHLFTPHNTQIRQIIPCRKPNDLSPVAQTHKAHRPKSGPIKPKGSAHKKLSFLLPCVVAWVFRRSFLQYVKRCGGGAPASPTATCFRGNILEYALRRPQEANRSSGCRTAWLNWARRRKARSRGNSCLCRLFPATLCRGRGRMKTAPFRASPPSAGLSITSTRFVTLPFSPTSTKALWVNYWGVIIFKIWI